MSRVSEEIAEQYLRILREQRESGGTQVIANRYPWHCKLALTELLNDAIELQRESDSETPVIVRILTGTCNDHVYGNADAMEHFETFLHAGGQIRVLVWNHSLDENCSVAKLRANFPGLKMKKSGTNVRGNELHHFVVVGMKSYRFEEPHLAVEAHEFDDFFPEIPASICFSDQRGAEQLVRFFDEIWKVCPPTAP